MQWKRNIHKRYGSVLIETYSYENSEGTLIKNLKAKLEQNNITLHKRDPKDILSQLEKSETYKDFKKNRSLVNPKKHSIMLSKYLFKY